MMSQVLVKTWKLSRNLESQSADEVCFFCDKAAGDCRLHSSSSFRMDKTVRLHATKLNDTRLLAKLSAGDVIALEVKYHKSCYTDFVSPIQRQSAM